MNLFRNLRNALLRFMYGRNGMDSLNKALFAVYLVLCLLMPIAARTLKSAMVAHLCNLILYALMFYLFFRIFSRNLPRRREENQRWLSWWWSVRSRGSGARARHADKEHKYFTCRNCGTICRVPVGKGKIVITCPKCGAKIQAKT